MHSHAWSYRLSSLVVFICENIIETRITTQSNNIQDLGLLLDRVGIYGLISTVASPCKLPDVISDVIREVNSLMIWYWELSAHVYFSLKKYQKFVTVLIIDKERTTQNPTYMYALSESYGHVHSQIFINDIWNHFDAVVISGIIFRCKSGINEQRHIQGILVGNEKIIQRVSIFQKKSDLSYLLTYHKTMSSDYWRYCISAGFINWDAKDTVTTLWSCCSLFYFII